MQTAIQPDTNTIVPAKLSLVSSEGAKLPIELKEALKERPNDLNLHFKLALAYYQAGRPDEAIRRLNTIANHLAGKGHYNTALSVNRSLLKLAPWHQEALSRDGALNDKMHVLREIHVHPVRQRLFAGIPSDGLTQIAKLIRVERYPAQTPVLREGETGSEFYIVYSGSVDVFVSDRNRHNHVLATIGEGDFFGEGGILTGCPRTATVQTRSDTEFWVLGYRECQHLMRIYPQVKEILYRTCEARRQDTARRIRGRGIERRVFPRVPTNMPGHVEFQSANGSASGRYCVPVRVMDLSASGAGLSFGEASGSILARCTRGTPVTLSFLIDEHSGVCVGTRIERVSRSEGDRSVFVGVSFTNVNQVHRGIINKYITRAMLR